MVESSVGQTIRIQVDDREARGSSIASRLAAVEGVSVAVKRLRTGDYLIAEKAVSGACPRIGSPARRRTPFGMGPGGCPAASGPLNDATTSPGGPFLAVHPAWTHRGALEYLDRLLKRKRVPDFLESLFDGRLFAQAQRLANTPLRAFLILEGPSSDWAQRHIKRESVQGAMLTLSVVFGIPILRAQNEEETARLICYTARQMLGASTSPPNRPGRRPRGKRAIQIRVLTSLSRVGVKRAQHLIESFGTLEQVMAANPKELAAVPGIGKQTPQSIHWAAHEDGMSYYL